jgi:photosystem II stability/assembly factor-like uncharacterized protein
LSVVRCSTGNGQLTIGNPEDVMAKAGLLFVGTGDGLVLFSNPNNIGRWLRIGQPFREKAIRAVWPHPENPLVVLAAVAGIGVQRSDDGGQSWQVSLAAEASAIVGARSAQDRVHLSTADGAIYRSDDAGATWLSCPVGGWPASSDIRLVVGAKDAGAVYVGASDGLVWVSRDGGSVWAHFGDRLGAPVAALSESFLPVGMLALAGGALYQSDGQEPWQPIELPGPATEGLAALMGQTPAWLVAQAAGGIARSEDGGATWTLAEGSTAAPIGVIAPVSYHIDTAFAGDSAGDLLSSGDRGRSWQIVKQNLPPVLSIAAARLI